MTTILVLQGANMNWLGLREPEKYGTTTAAELDERIRRFAEERGFAVEIFQTNVEGEAINRLYRAHEQGVDAVVMNPGGFSYAGYALGDCVRGIKVPVVEVHMTNHYARGIESASAAAARMVLMGGGIEIYFVGLEAALRLAHAAQPSR
jgi:3-dehydroquinate dehydratase II